MRSSKARGSWIVAAATVAAFSLILATSSSAATAADPCTTSGTPIVTTDKLDYEPGETGLLLCLGGLMRQQDVPLEARKGPGLV